MAKTESRICSPFSARSTAADIVSGHDLAGRNAIVTGASSGIGIETVRALADAGARVVLAVRDTTAGEAVARSIGGDTSVEFLDLARLDSVRAFAARQSRRPLHLLINNAGVMATPQGYTTDGFETQLGINHLGHFLLTLLLTPALLQAAPARVIQVSSAGHQIADMDFDDPHFRQRAYHPFVAYGQSKTANSLFAVGYNARHAARGITTNAVMPGAVVTNLGRHVTPELSREMGWVREDGSVPDMIWKTPAQGAATSLWAAVGRELEGQGGRYLEDCQEAVPWTSAHPLLGVKPYALDPARADRLWSFSLDAVGLEATR
ncbi:MAG: SDR family NAD(P)-dependent oxidoreductase [Proteobacteria bacterium]|nr:SDR family NAD(P)-dependent oxidoreductase [Pseudomonadota bacterium]HQR04487.1 SDR family NAD(P)-dependent oxidoreductase [Rhodocyclaceae bacterium]